jgi:hypothetical protein
MASVMNIASSLPLVRTLLADHPAPDLAENLKLYLWLVGKWEMDVAMREVGDTQASLRGMISAAWVLEGRAIQDVFAVPGLFYGTACVSTIRTSTRGRYFGLIR